MNFTVKKTDIVNAVSKINGIVENRNSVPILSNLAISAGRNGLNICASDMDINASLDCPAVVSEIGDFTVPARQFFDICKKASEEEIHVEVKNDRASIKSGRSKFTLGTLPYEDFPKFTVASSNEGFTIDSGFMLKLLDDVELSMGDNESSHYLMGVFLHEIEGYLKAVTTNGNRLSLSTGDAVGGFPEVIIPRKTVSLLQKLLLAYDGDIKVLSTENKIQFTIGNCVLVSRVIDGKFPDYCRILPKSYPESFSVDTSSAIQALDRITTIEEKSGNRLKITVSKDSVTFDRLGKDEDASDQIDAEYKGKGFVVHVNSQFVSDALRKIKTGKTIVQFGTPDSPLLFTAENDETASWLVGTMKGN